jgi:primosomal protein N' (replication factor Y)
LLRLGVTGRRLGLTEEAARQLAAAVAATLAGPGIEVLGPAPAVFPRLKDRYRFQILIKGTLDSRQKSWLGACLAHFREEIKGVDVVHDVDPVSMY